MLGFVCMELSLPIRHSSCSFTSFSFPPGIVEYMGEQAGPPSKQVQAGKQVQELIKDGDDAVIVGVFSGEQDAAYEIYIEACEYQELEDLANNVTHHLM